MNPKAAEIFRQALDLSEGREAFARRQCGDDPELLSEVLRLLVSVENPVLMQLPELDLSSLESISGPEHNRAGELVGNYRLLSELGRGGMGAVWLAERTGEYAQKVAIKWLHAGLSQNVRARFWRERQTLAKLSHPGIARIVDGGSGGEADWFAMEYAQGLPLHHYLENHQPTLRERLLLFCALCEAVSYAHQNLIVHRDLKPSNVIVDALGKPKLLDFGIAKLLDSEDETASRAPMTFAYAAPEQIKNESITTRTDVYALGVILFEMLTGERPHKLKGNGSLSLLQAITDTDATAPSTLISRRAEAARAIDAHQLKGDLDTIVLKALSRDPSRRYASVAALQDDVQRMLTFQPILARADTLTYRVAKFVRRNRLLVTISACALLAVLGFSIRSTLDAAAANQARSVAETERARAQAVQRFLTDLFADQRPDLAQDQDITARDLLDRAEARLSDPKLDVADDAVRAELLDTLARLRYDLSDFDSALRHNEASVALAERRFGRNSPEYGLTLLERADTLWWLGRIDETLQECQRGLEILRTYDAQTRPEATELAHQTKLIDCADSARSQDQFEQTKDWQNEAEQRAQTRPPIHRSITQNLLRSRAKLANAQNDHARSISLNLELLAQLQSDPDTPPSDIATLQHGLGVSQLKLGDGEGAVSSLRAALSSHKKIFGLHGVWVNSSRRTLALALDEIGDAKGASDLMAEALRAARAQFETSGADFVLAVRDAGLLALRHGEQNSAQRLLIESLRNNEHSYGVTHSVSLQIRLLLWEQAIDQKRIADAKAQASFFATQANALNAISAEVTKRLLLKQARLDGDTPMLQQRLQALATQPKVSSVLPLEERVRHAYEIAKAAQYLQQAALVDRSLAEFHVLKHECRGSKRLLALIDRLVRELEAQQTEAVATLSSS